MKSTLQTALAVFISFFIITGQNISYSLTSESTDYGGYYIGTINKKYPIQMSLMIEEEVIFGFYYYTSIGDPLSLSGNIKNSNIVLKESDPNGNITGTFNGEFLANGYSFSGEWISGDGTKTFSFELHKVADYKRQYLEKEYYYFSAYYPDLTNNAEATNNLDTEFEQYVAEEEKEFVSFCDETLENWTPDFGSLYRESSYEIQYFNQYAISILGFHSEYGGGAHGNIFYTVSNYELTEEGYKEISIADFFLASKKKEALNHLSSYLIQSLEIMEAEWIVVGDITSFDENDLQVFCFNSKNLMFQFAPYVVGPYVQGPFMVQVPFQDLEQYLDPNGIAGSITE